MHQRVAKWSRVALAPGKKVRPIAYSVQWYVQRTLAKRGSSFCPRDRCGIPNRAGSFRAQIVVHDKPFCEDPKTQFTLSTIVESPSSLCVSVAKQATLLSDLC